MSKLQLSENKVLKLKNTLIKTVDFTDENEDLNLVVEKMQSFIKVKGAMQIGPLIQYIRTFINSEGELGMEIKILLQCNNYIHSVEYPYTMESVLRVPNCMYCRYTGPEDKLSFAYDKIRLEAFEKDISLKNENYTIFVDRDDENEKIIADVFLERTDL